MTGSDTNVMDQIPKAMETSRNRPESERLGPLRTKFPLAVWSGRILGAEAVLALREARHGMRNFDADAFQGFLSGDSETRGVLRYFLMLRV